MSERNELWEKIIEALEDTLQFGFLEEARYVSAIRVEGNALVVSIPPTSAEAERAFHFLAKPENSQRILILAKRIFPALSTPEIVKLRQSGAKLEGIRVTQEE